MLPDKKHESDTERDGVLSYAGEWHALIIGGAAGLIGGIFYTTAFQSVGIGAMAAVAVVALGLHGSMRLTNKLAAGEVEHEPWYALGGIIIGFLLATSIRLVLSLAGI